MRNNYDEHINQGIRYYDQREYDLAIESYQKAIAINPEDASVYGLLGLTYSKQEKEEAIYHYNLACVYSIQGKRQICIESLWKAISLDRNYIKMVEENSDFDNIRESPEYFEKVATIFVYG